MKSSFHFSPLGHNTSKTHSFTWHLNRQELAALDINGYSYDWLFMWDFMIRTELQSPENSCPTQIHSFFIFMFSPHMKMENQYLKIRVIDIARDPHIPFLRLQTKWQWKHARLNSLEITDSRLTVLGYICVGIDSWFTIYSLLMYYYMLCFEKSKWTQLVHKPQKPKRIWGETNPKLQNSFFFWTITT